jgi:hypothetical protein
MRGVTSAAEADVAPTDDVTIRQGEVLSAWEGGEVCPSMPALETEHACALGAGESCQLGRVQRHKALGG